MGDEEFDGTEEYVPEKSGIPWKGVAKGILIMIIVISGIYLMNQNTGNNFTVGVLGFLLICLGSFFMNYEKPKKKKVKNVYSVYKCLDSECGVKELHEFKDGDYVYKKIGPCWKCDPGHMVISQIFAVYTLPRDKVKIAPPERTLKTLD